MEAQMDSATAVQTLRDNARHCISDDDAEILNLAADALEELNELRSKLDSLSTYLSDHHGEDAEAIIARYQSREAERPKCDCGDPSCEEDYYLGKPRDVRETK
jgi:hypothetical protein